MSRKAIIQVKPSGHQPISTWSVCWGIPDYP